MTLLIFETDKIAYCGYSSERFRPIGVRYLDVTIFEAFMLRSDHFGDTYFYILMTNLIIESLILAPIHIVTRNNY